MVLSRYMDNISCSLKCTISLYKTGSWINSEKFAFLTLDYRNGRSPVTEISLKSLTPSEWCKYSNLSQKNSFLMPCHCIILLKLPVDVLKVSQKLSIHCFNINNILIVSLFCYANISYFGLCSVIWFCKFQRFCERQL